MSHQKRSRLRRGTLGAAALGACVLSGLALTACKSTTPGAAGPSASASVSASGAASGTVAAPTSGCTPDYCAPASWETARASTPLPQIPAFAEPLNVVLSARSDVSLSAIQQALGDWDTVHANTQVSVAGIHIMCISPEKADVAAGGYVTQQAAWRLDGCVHGNELSVTGKEGHVRMWHQTVPGSANGAWFITASYETMCLVRDGRLQAVASGNRAYAILHPSAAYHCVNGGPGSITSHYANGYDDGARAFAAAITAAARNKGWHVGQQVVTVPRAVHAGEGGVPFGSGAYVLTVTREASGA